MKANIQYVWDPQGGTDTRSIKLRITFKRDHRYYSIPSKTKMTKEEFEQARKKDVKEAIRVAEMAKIKAQEICDELGNNFSFFEFKLRYDNAVNGKALPQMESQSSLSVQSLFNEYVRARAIKPNTVIIYKAAIHHILKVRKTALVSDITTSFINEMLKQMKANELERTGKDMSANTIGIHLRSLKTIFQFAVDNGYIKTNPINGIKIPHAPRQKTALTEDEWKRFLAYKPQDEKEEFAYDMVVLTFALCGANMADILRLKNENIKGDTICFVRQKTERVDTQVSIPLIKEALEIMNKYGNVNERHPKQYIFPYYIGAVSEEQRNMRRDAVLKKVNGALKSICAHIGIHSFTTYNIRHTFALMGVENGNIGIETMRHLLGHKNISTTQIYLSGITTTSIGTTRDFISNSLIK